MNKKIIGLIILAGFIFNLFFPAKAYFGSFFIVMGAIFLIASTFGKDENKSVNVDDMPSDSQKPRKSKMKTSIPTNRSADTLTVLIIIIIILIFVFPNL